MHAMVVSETILKLLEPLPEKIQGGEIVRDADGKATGRSLI